MTFCVVSLTKTARPSVALVTMPSSRSAGRCASGTGGGGVSTRAAASAGGGRRDGKKIGRSRVAVNDSRGIPQRGFPLIDGCAVGAASIASPGAPGVLLDSAGFRAGGSLAARQRLIVAALTTAIAIPMHRCRAVICCLPKVPRLTIGSASGRLQRRQQVTEPPVGR